jgi:signal recognition particle subunit SRP54
LHIDEELMESCQYQEAKLTLSRFCLCGRDDWTGCGSFGRRVSPAHRYYWRVLTKMDGDARGGAALSIKQVIGQPVKFVGVGEKYDALEPFYPDRVAQRILGMGDVLSLIEEVQSKVDQSEAEEQLKKLQKNEFTLDDFRSAAAPGKKAWLFLKNNEASP